MSAIKPPFEIFYDASGRPADNAKIYIGAEGQNPETNPVTVYWDEAQTIPAQQPLRTINGAIYRGGNKAQVFGPSRYSIAVKGANDDLFAYSASVANTLSSDDIDYGFETVTDALDVRIKTVDTFADLSLTDAVIGSQVSVLGHTTRGIGGGLFDVVSSSGLAADNGYVAINAGIAFVRVDDFSNGINIENYGAKRVCANSGDATINSNAFLDALEKADDVGSFVFLPFIYSINRLATIAYFIRCKGADRDKSGLRIYWDGGSTHPFVSSSSPYISSTHGCDFENMSFDQQWKYKVTAGAPGYDDSKFAALWGGYFIAEFNTTDTVKLDNVRFYDTCRGFLSTGSHVKATRIFSESPEAVVQSLVACDSSKSCKILDCEVIGPRWDVEPLFGGYPVTGNSAFFGHDVEDLVIDNLIMEGQQIVFRGENVGGVSKRAVVTNVKLTSPPGDTAFYSWEDLTISQVDIKYSGDMGLAIAATRRCSIGNINVNGCHIGGVAVVGSEFVSVSGPITVWDVAQNYTRIKLFNRYASTAGPWASAFVMDFKAGSTKAVENIIGNITAGFNNIPEVSDTYGPVRSKVFGIFIEPTPSAQSHTYTLSNCRIPDYRGSGLTSFNIFSTEHRFYLAPASRTGTPVVGEKFSNGANTFIYLSDFGDGSYCNIKRLVGAISPTTVYTGATSGATLTSAILPQLEWLKVVQVGNFDWTTEGPDGR